MYIHKGIISFFVRFDSVLDKCWLSECLLFKALALWNMSDTHASYATLLKVSDQQGMFLKLQPLFLTLCIVFLSLPSTYY